MTDSKVAKQAALPRRKLYIKELRGSDATDLAIAIGLMKRKRKAKAKRK